MKIIFCFLLNFSVFACYAQSADQPAFRRFAFQAGANVSNMNFNKGYMAAPVHYENSWKTGFTVGFLIRVPLAKNFFLQPEYTYTQRKGADKNLVINYSLDYFSMPILLNYKITRSIAVLAGPQVEILLNAQSGNNGVSTSITHDTEERSIGVTAGLEVEIKKIFIFSARYLHGLNHIGIGQRSSAKEFTYESAIITAGIRF